MKHLDEQKRERALMILSEAIDKAVLKIDKSKFQNRGYSIEVGNDYGLKNYTINSNGKKSDKFYLQGVAVIVAECISNNIELSSFALKKIIKEEKRYFKNIVDMKYYEHIFKTGKPIHLEDRYNTAKLTAMDSIQKIRSVIKSQLAANLAKY